MTVMKTLLTTAVVFAIAPSAMAASSTDLTVTGKIVPASCGLSLSSPELNYGKISASDLDPDKATKLAKKAYTLDVTCNGDTQFALQPVDNRINSVVPVGESSVGLPPRPHFGLGFTPANEPIGGFTISLYPTRSTIGDAPAFLISRGVSSTTGNWSTATSSIQSLHPNRLTGLTDTVGVTTGPLPASKASFGLESTAYIARASSLTLTSDVTLDGSVTIELKYI